MPERIRILHLIETLGSGGAEKLLYTNLKHLDRDAYEHQVVTVFSRGVYWKEPIGELGISVESLGCRNLRSIVSGVRRLRPVIKKFRPDIIHTHLWSANIIGRIAGALAGVKVISSIHAPEYEPEAVGTVSASVQGKLRLARLIDRITARFGCDRMIAVSRYVKVSTNRRLGFPLHKIDVLYNPVDFAGIGENGSRNEIFDRLGLARDSRLILNVGRVVPQKGLRHAIRAMPAIVDAFRNAHFVSVGNLESEKHVSVLRDLISDRKVGEWVHLAGERRDIGAILAHCDVFIFPSVLKGSALLLQRRWPPAAPASCTTSPH